MAIRFLLPAFAVLAVLASAGPAAAQQPDVRSLVDRIDRLQRDVDVLQRQLARGGAPAPGPAAAAQSGGGGVSSDYIGRSEDRFSGLEDQVRDLTGKLEELNHKISEVSLRLDKLVSDVDFRLNAIERGGAQANAPGQSGDVAPPPAAAPSQSANNTATSSDGRSTLILRQNGRDGQPAATGGTQAAAVAPQIQLPQGSPEAQYEFAYGILLQAQRGQGQADFARAAQALRAFLGANASHRLAGNAQYWLGETYYAQRDYQGAATTFAEGLQKYPRSDKAPDNLLKLGMSLGRLNRKPEACGTLAELDKRFPSAPATVKQAAQRERSSLACT